MRLLKKVIRKIYHLIWFLSIFLLFSPNVHAVAGIVQIDGSAFETASFASFGDVSNGQITRYGAVWTDNGSYFRSSQSILTTGGSTDGASVLFDANQTFVAGYTYVVSIIIGFANGYPKASTPRVCIAETIPNVTTRWNNQSQFPCPSAQVTNTTNVASYTDGTMTYQYGLLNYVFTSNVTGTTIAVAYQSSVRNESNHTFGGYRVTLLSDNKNLTQSQITSAVQSSGLATASSVNQVQSSINSLQQEMSAIEQQQQQTNQKLDNIDDTLNDSSIDSSDNTINNLKNQLPTNSVISDLLLLPVRLLQAIINSLGGTCASFNLGSLYGTELIMPCINIPSYLGNTIWSFIDIVFSGMFILVIRKKFIQIFENVTNLRNGGNEVD